jgi:hypothetical protein
MAASGQTTIGLDGAINLDAGANVHRTGAGADVALFRPATAITTLTARSPGFRGGGTAAIGPTRCITEVDRQAQENRTLPLATAPVNRFFCVKTSANRVAEIQIVSKTANTVTLRYNTWTRPGQLQAPAQIIQVVPQVRLDTVQLRLPPQ